MNTTAFSEGGVRGFLDRPERPNGDGVVLAHGAGGNCEAALLVAVAQALSGTGAAILRCDLPFRQKRRFGAPSPSSAVADRAGLREAVAVMRGLAPGRILLGGQSYGGRQASILTSEDSNAASALLLLSYPLHAPGKAGALRTAHFSSLRIPALFVHGSRDPFGSIDEMQAAIRIIPAHTVLIEVPGAGHDLLRGKFDLGRLVVEPLRALLA